MRRTTKTIETKKLKAKGVNGEVYLAAQMQDAEFRHHFEQRRLVHEVALAIRGMRAGAGLTQAQLARRIGTSQPSIARIEKGLDQRTPQWETLRKIAAALGRQLKIVFTQPSSDSCLVEVHEPTPSRALRGRQASRAQATR